ncbi:hypothetical protein [Mesorhizobium australicum]|uniref:Uncharacterized protein n=1 Tax=Mesorhizobium australicum TaxID=536018 RepID=A0A1X7N1N6_9HYPH|nr:hypothetical protein [Mesorhizobium australicum]SMH30285.1 hypothetical protein SAMN02982922_1027 [Mesorhizobium australicum]
MSSKSNDENAAIGVVVAVIAFAALFFFALLAFAALVFTVLALLAWKKPLRLGRFVITPDEAHAFVGRGLIGMALAPTFWAFCCILFGLPFEADYLGYLLIGGYTLGSVGIEILTADDEPPAAAPDHTPPPALPTPADKAPAPTEPFRFATWDDEEKPS